MEKPGEQLVPGDRRRRAESPWSASCGCPVVPTACGTFSGTGPSRCGGEGSPPHHRSTNHGREHPRTKRRTCGGGLDRQARGGATGDVDHDRLRRPRSKLATRCRPHSRHSGPGNAGNCGIAGHRDTFFRQLRHVELGDMIRITTPDAVRLYEVAWTRIVEPTSVEVLAPSDSTLLTLVTCYPFQFLGSAPQRYIVRAVATSADGRSADPRLPAMQHLPERSASWHDASTAETTTTRASN